MNDFFNHMDCEVVMYADDTCCIISAQSKSDLQIKAQHILNKIHTYLKENKLYLNAEKTVVMSFNNNPIEIFYENRLLKVVDKFKLLGIIIDNKFKFKEHMLYLNNKISSTQYIFNNLKTNKIPTSIKKLIFDSFVKSHITYSSYFILNINKTYFNKIKCTYNKIIKFINPNLISLDNIIYIAILKFIKNILIKKIQKQYMTY